MWRVVGVVERMGHTLTTAGNMLDAVMTALDEEVGVLRAHLISDALELRSVVAKIDVSEADRDRLLDVVGRMEETAARVAAFTQRPSDADEQIDTLLRGT